jgi:histidyl-tRNA synthetase
MGRPKKATPNVEKAPGRLPGSLDFLPEHHLAWEVFLEKLASLSHTFGYAPVDSPMFEDSRLFSFWMQNGAQLLTVANPKGNPVAARPANIFSLARVYLENHFAEREKVTKWSYHAPVAYLSGGQIRQPVEYGFQIFGPTAPIADAQLVNLLLKLFTETGLGGLSLELNNVGCLECLPRFQEQLKSYFKDKKYDLCDDCLEHLEENRPLQILACTNLSCTAAAAEAPASLDFICENCRHQFIGVLEGLDELSVPYNLNQKVIGPPWARRTVFEIRCSAGQREISLGAGSHADDLIQSLGGEPTPALGFAGYAEAVLSALDLSQVKFAAKNKVDVFLVPVGELAAKKTLRLFTELWNNDILVSEFIGASSIKTQLKLAESNKVSIALIIGQKEARDGTVILRDVRSGMQELFTYERIIEEVKKRLGK